MTGHNRGKLSIDAERRLQRRISIFAHLSAIDAEADALVTGALSRHGTDAFVDWRPYGDTDILAAARRAQNEMLWMVLYDLDGFENEEGLYPDSPYLRASLASLLREARSSMVSAILGMPELLVSYSQGRSRAILEVVMGDSGQKLISTLAPGSTETSDSEDSEDDSYMQARMQLCRARYKLAKAFDAYLPDRPGHETPPFIADAVGALARQVNDARKTRPYGDRDDHLFLYERSAATLFQLSALDIPDMTAAQLARACLDIAGNDSALVTDPDEGIVRPVLQLPEFTG